MPFTPQNSANLRSLLDNTPLLQELHKLRPPIEGSTLESKAMSSSVLEGYEKCMSKIEELATPPRGGGISSPYVAGLEGFEQIAQSTL